MHNEDEDLMELLVNNKSDSLYFLCGHSGVCIPHTLFDRKSKVDMILFVTADTDNMDINME